MRTKIYQIDKDTFGTKFMDYDFTMQKAGEIRPELYQEVFNADIDEENLEEVYTRFNSTHHPLFRGHSLSVSDVVVNDKGAFFVDSIGFKKIDFDESKTHKPDNLMRIVYVEPHRPAFEAEMGDQALMGSVVEILDRKGSWVQIRTGEPYTAWVVELGLIPMDAEALKAYIAAPKWICTAAVTRVYDAPPAGRNPGAILCELVAGNLVRVVQASRSRKGYTPVLLPDGRTGWVCAKEVAPFDAWASAYGASRTVTGPTDEGSVSTARRFLGVPYMWGGTSIKNVDCSGLTRSTFFLNGILLPRNASQQAYCGIPVEPADGPRFWDSLQPGDLVFWGREATADKPAKATHVGIYIGGREFFPSKTARTTSHCPKIIWLGPDYLNSSRTSAGMSDTFTTAILLPESGVSRVV